MKNLSMIACVSSNLGIGKNNRLLWHFKSDMQFFKDMTAGRTVIMGARTFESIGHALPGRRNLVLSREKLPGIEEVPDKTDYSRVTETSLQVFHDKDALDAYIKKLPGEKFIIGGASLYALYLPEAENLYLTEVHKKKPADAFFPAFVHKDYKRRVLKRATLDGIDMDFVKYTRKG